MNQLDLPPLNNMSVKKKLESENPLNSDQSVSTEILPQIGSSSESEPKPEISTEYHQTYSFGIMDRYDTLLRIMQSLSHWYGQSTFITVKLEWVKVSEPGMKPECQHTLKIRVLNFGAVIKVRKMLSSMNFEEASTYRTSSDGWTDIQYLWKSKGVHDL